PFYLVLEGITKRRIGQKLIEDDIPECLVGTKTCVATLVRMPPRARAFITENYVPVSATLCVAGKYLGRTRENQRLEFDLKIPARYALSLKGNLAGRLDGKPYDGPRDLEAGRHTFEVMSGKGKITLLWAKAAERGYGLY